MNNQATYGNTFTLGYKPMDYFTIDQHQIVVSDAFKAWVLKKIVQESLFFYNEEHAISAYMYELGQGSGLQPFLWEPNSLGTLSSCLGEY
jgi:hypothetical protein